MPLTDSLPNGPASKVAGGSHCSGPVRTNVESGAGGQMHDLYEFTRRTLEMNLHLEPGPQLAELVHEIFALEAVAVFDADLHEVYQAGIWNVDPQELAQNVYYFETSTTIPRPASAAAWSAWERCRSEAWWCAATPARSPTTPSPR
jgi:hypothetical protein